MDYARLNRLMHDSGPDVFAGMSVMKHAGEIGSLIRETGSRSLLDYGCGKGRQYFDEGLHHHWGVPRPALFDIGVRAFSDKPPGQFDGVICTDVLEHVAEKHLPDVWADLFGYAKRFLFVAVCTRPARKTYPDGTNVHATVMPACWWRAQAEMHRAGTAKLVLKASA